MRSAALALTSILCACTPKPLNLGDEPAPESSSATTTPDGSTDSATSAGDSSSATTTPDDPNDSASTFADSTTTPGEPLALCNPSAGSNACRSPATCCSDDPAAVGGKPPNYFNGDTDLHGEPIFSAANNDLGISGLCIVTGEFASPFPSGCPVPCNPTWAPEILQEICGTTAICCQTTDLDPDRDCVIDPQTQRWRAVTGHDIGTPLTIWGDQHTTNQDPLGAGCMQFATDEVMNDTAAPEPDMAALEDCFDQLTVANQRGLCQQPGTCPCREDLCDAKNPGWVPTCP